jgi:hypothetical protein
VWAGGKKRRIARCLDNTRQAGEVRHLRAVATLDLNSTLQLSAMWKAVLVTKPP